ncbi:uncharacterized protein LOC130673566 isoform X1 [Microplitis mediator]|uniref:uncharacterized protein LOC130673566 isoform X1 n=1 Tax=Microplitis mediator TaxID=375433 RepID=UPI002555176D|nr:uncharacterized protein LOC130673566 isoform X1 [Microplitis mediator]
MSYIIFYFVYIKLIKYILFFALVFEKYFSFRKMETSNSESSDNKPITPPEQTEELNSEEQDEEEAQVSHSSVPEYSKDKYLKVYDNFTTWRKKNNYNDVSEKILVKYFAELNKTKKPSTLWSQYSMLKSTLNQNNNIDIAKYKKLHGFLKKLGTGFRNQKAKVLTKANISDFLNKAPDSIYLAEKVIMIFGIVGACRKPELCNLTVRDIVDNGTNLVVTTPSTMGIQRMREFTIDGDFYTMVKMYLDLRPKDVKINRIFLNYQKGKCTQQPIGINKIGGVPRKIARFLKLPDADKYTGHCFRRTSTELLAHDSTNILSIAGGWKANNKKGNNPVQIYTKMEASTILKSCLPETTKPAANQTHIFISQLPLNQGQLIAHQGQLVTNQGQLVTNQGHLIIDPGQSVTNQGQLITNQFQVNQGHLIYDQGQSVTNQGQLVTNQGQLVTNQGQLITNHGHIIIDPGQSMINQGQLITNQFQLNQGQLTTNQLPVNQEQLITSQLPVNQEQLITQQGQLVTNQGQSVTHQFQINTNQLPVNQGQLITQQGQLVTNQGQSLTNQGQLNTNQLPVNQGQLITQQGQLVTNQGQSLTNQRQLNTNQLPVNQEQSKTNQSSENQGKLNNNQQGNPVQLNNQQVNRVKLNTNQQGDRVQSNSQQVNRVQLVNKQGNQVQLINNQGNQVKIKAKPAINNEAPTSKKLNLDGFKFVVVEIDRRIEVVQKGWVPPEGAEYVKPHAIFDSYKSASDFAETVNVKKTQRPVTEVTKANPEVISIDGDNSSKRFAIKVNKNIQGKVFEINKNIPRRIVPGNFKANYQTVASKVIRSQFKLPNSGSGIVSGGGSGSSSSSSSSSRSTFVTALGVNKNPKRIIGTVVNRNTPVISVAGGNKITKTKRFIGTLVNKKVNNNSSVIAPAGVNKDVSQNSNNSVQPNSEKQNLNPGNVIIVVEKVDNSSNLITGDVNPTTAQIETDVKDPTLTSNPPPPQETTDILEPTIKEDPTIKEEFINEEFIDENELMVVDPLEI